MQKVLIVDDAPEVCRAWTRMLKRLGVEAATVGDGFEALDLLQRDDGFDLVFVDHVMPGCSGLEVIQRSPAAIRNRMVLITADLQPELSLKAHNQGVLVLRKPVEPVLVQHLIEEKSRQRRSGKTGIDQTAATACCDRFADRFGLTRRQQEILHALVSGRTSRDEIAEVLGCTPKTVDAHLQAIFAKTGIRSQLGLALALLHVACD